jgi:hypothetical protein
LLWGEKESRAGEGPDQPEGYKRKAETKKEDSQTCQIGPGFDL